MVIEKLTENATLRPGTFPAGPNGALASKGYQERCQTVRGASGLAAPVDLGHLICRVNQQTQQQVRDLSIDHRDGGLVVTGRSRTYYAKQLVTQVILTSLPAVRLVNEICVG